MNLPNKLTMLRVFMIPFFVIFMLCPLQIPYNNLIALAIFASASFTDYLDGHIARKYHLITNFGKFMDPLADKLLVVSAMVCLVKLGELAAWIVIIIICREFTISAFRLIAAENQIVIAASYWGKSKTVCQMAMVILLLLDLPGMFFLVDYIYKNRAVLKEQS
jgi:CDP-diacylglycerol--glycerol-3-phosphate 3-phosphatidyltransferase